jgi:hypothetical protein
MALKVLILTDGGRALKTLYPDDTNLEAVLNVAMGYHKMP